jgi:hypothetical protein
MDMLSNISNPYRVSLTDNPTADYPGKYPFFGYDARSCLVKDGALGVTFFANLGEPFSGYWVPSLIAARSEINNKCDRQDSIGFFQRCRNRFMIMLDLIARLQREVVTQRRYQRCHRIHIVVVAILEIV